MSEGKATVLLGHYLRTLRLPTMPREYGKLAAVCQADRADYPTYLLRLAEREVQDREVRAAERRVKAAKFPLVKTLDTFDFAAQPSLNQQLVRELVGGDYMDRRENVLLIGNSGTGKSHLAAALAFAACQQGRRVRFFTVTGLVTQLLERREERQLERFHQQLERHPLLVLDELGYVPFTKAGAGLLFEVVRRAYARTSLLVTTNLPFTNLTPRTKPVRLFVELKLRRLPALRGKDGRLVRVARMLEWGGATGASSSPRAGHRGR